MLTYARFLILAAMCLSLAWTARAQSTANDAVASADALMSAGKYQEALEAYLAVTRTDSRNAAAQHGAGMAHNALGQTALAVKAFERACALAPKDRAIVHNGAMAIYKNDSQPRGIKLMRDYLAANPRPADEAMLESLRFMLEQANEDTRKTRFYTDVEAFALQYTRSLERQRPGFAKWGGAWITTKKAADNAVADKKVQAEIDVISDRIRLIERDMKMLDRRTPEIESLVRRGFDPQYVLDQHLDKLRSLGDQRADAMRERLTVMSRLKRPAPAADPGWIALGTPAPELPSIEELAAATTVAPPPVPTPQPEPPVTQKPDEPGQEPPIANNPPGAPHNPPPPPPAATKRVTRYGVAFAISQDTLVTSADLVGGAREITVQSPQGTTDEGTVVKSDAKSGLCLIRITKLKAAALRIAAGFDGGAVECVGMPNVDLFRPDATSIAGKSNAPAEPWTVTLDKNPRLPGAPLLSGGKVVGVTLATRDTEPDAVPAVTLTQLTTFIGQDIGTPGAFSNQPKDAIFQIVATHESK